ncbi:MAG: PAS domain-containing protein, partial [Psychrosphaera sp.]|nr:PAS domain-containing protein [Psychrosphaera sp.]
MFDPEFKLRFMSQSGVKALKINNIEPYYGHVFPDDSAPKCTQDIVSQYMRRAAEGEANTIEYSFEVEGQIVWFRTTIIPYFNEKDQLIYITGDSMDITSTIKSEETNRTLLETTDICLKEIKKNEDGSGFTLMFMSPAGQKQLGISNIESLYGGPYPPDFYPQEPKKALIEALNDQNVRDIAVESLGRMGPSAKEAVSVLKDKLNGTKRVAVAAAFSLWQIEHEAENVIPALIGGVKNQDREVR